MKYLKVVVVAIFMILILGVGNSVFATDKSVVENYIKDNKINVNKCQQKTYAKIRQY